MTTPIPVVASVAWKCEPCGARDTLNLGHSCDVLGLMARVKHAHRIASPSCTSEACPTFEQIAIADDAVVNDPRERAYAKAAEGGRGSRRLHVGALVAAMFGGIDMGSSRGDRSVAPEPTAPEPPRSTPHENFIERQQQRASGRRAVADAERAERRATNGWRNGPLGVKLVERAKAKRERRAVRRKSERDESFSTASSKSSGDRNALSTETTGGAR